MGMQLSSIDLMMDEFFVHRPLNSGELAVRLPHERGFMNVRKVSEKHD